MTNPKHNPDHHPDRRPLPPEARRSVRALLDAEPKLHPCERIVGLGMAEGMSIRDIGVGLCMTGRRLRELFESLTARAELRAAERERREHPHHVAHETQQRKYHRLKRLRKARSGTR